MDLSSCSQLTGMQEVKMLSREHAILDPSATRTLREEFTGEAEASEPGEHREITVSY